MLLAYLICTQVAHLPYLTAKKNCFVGEWAFGRVDKWAWSRVEAAKQTKI